MFVLEVNAHRVAVHVEPNRLVNLASQSATVNGDRHSGAVKVINDGERLCRMSEAMVGSELVHVDVEFGEARKFVVGRLIVLVSFNPCDLNGASKFFRQLLNEG